MVKMQPQNVVYVLPDSSRTLQANVKFVLKGALLALRHRGCAQHAKLISLLIRMTVQNASLQRFRLLPPAQTANSLTLRLPLAPRVRPCAKLVPDGYQPNASRVEPASLWGQGIGVSLLARLGSARVQN